MSEEETELTEEQHRDLAMITMLSNVVRVQIRALTRDHWRFQLVLTRGDDVLFKTNEDMERVANTMRQLLKEWESDGRIMPETPSDTAH